MKNETVEGHWLQAVVESVQSIQKDGGAVDLPRIEAELGSRLGLSEPVIRSMRLACDALAEYARGSSPEDEDSVDEEAHAVAASRRAVRPLLEARLQARIDRIDASMAGRRPGKQKGESHGRRGRTWESTLGPLQLKRRWRVCAEDGFGFSEAQQRLRLPDGPYTASLEESITLMATTVPHGLATQLLSKLMGLAVSEHGVQDAVERRGRGLMELTEREAQEQRPIDAKGFERDVPRPADAVPAPPNVAYLEIDGVIPMTRELDEEKSQPVDGVRGGKGRRYNLIGREVKNAVLYTDADCASESDSRGCILRKTYVSHLGAWTAFAAILWVAMRKKRFDQAGLLVILSDGAEWIRSLAEWLPIKAFLILDLYHAHHRVWEVARAHFGEHTPEGEAWAREQTRRIEAGRVADVIDCLKFLLPSATRAKDKIEALVTYFTNNRDRMDYPAYRAQGLRITSGTVESANYHVTGARLKLQGMRWSANGAAEMAALRADLFNDQWRNTTRRLLAA